MPRVNWDAVEGNSKIYMEMALRAGITRLSPHKSEFFEEASKRAVDPARKRAWRGLKKNVSRSPTARGVGATVAVGGAAALTAATGGGAALAAAVGTAAVLPLTALGIRLGIVAADKKLFGSNNDLGAIKSNMTKLRDRQKKSVEEFGRAQSISGGRAQYHPDLVVDYLTHIGKGMHHLSKRNKEAEAIVNYLKAEIFTDPASQAQLDRTWAAKLDAEENDILANVNRILAPLDNPAMVAAFPKGGFA